MRIKVFTLPESLRGGIFPSTGLSMTLPEITVDLSMSSIICGTGGVVSHASS